MSPHASSTHPLVAAYLTDLERALATTDPHEREDTLAAVREHIEDALGGAPQDAATAQAVLSDLGPVERIAATATPADRPTVVAPAASTDLTSAGLLLFAAASFAVVFALPLVAAPVAVGTLVGTLVQLRRTRGQRGMLRAGLALSIATLLVTVLMAMFLLSASPGAPVPGDVEPAQSDVS